MATRTIAEIENMVKNGELKQLHTASKRGYVSRKTDGIVTEYSGKFGEGYTIAAPRFDTTQYVNVTYYVK
jgi:uncharacterized lipoprotein